VSTSVFLSYPKPYNDQQKMFVDNLSQYLSESGFKPRTLGVTDYDMDAPLKAIRRLMLESNGLITIAFRRTFIQEGITKPTSREETEIHQKWLTSPYSHIEPAMAFQIGLPVLILREQGVMQDGILEKGVLGTYMPEFDLNLSTADYLSSNEWRQMAGQWEGKVRAVSENKGNPPRLY